MNNRLQSAVCLVVAAFAFSACAAEKSSNPLSPTVAGPIPGVNITAPAVMQPSVGARIAVDQQPVTLTIQNASTSGVRPLDYLFEVASDTDFTNKVFTKAAVAPGDGGKTSVRLSDPLETGRTYYWHARAQDGANTGAYSAPANFTVFTPIVISAPTLVSPIGNALTANLHPTLTVGNAPRSGPVGSIQYLIELADSDSFANKIAAWVFNEQSGQQSSLTAPQDLAYGKQYFWHARAFDPTTTGPFSTTDVFRTPAAPVVSTPPAGGSGTTSGSGGGCTGVTPDTLNQATIYNSPQDLATWCTSAHITSIQFTPSAFLVDFDKRTGPGSWPDSPFGDGSGGTVQYTLGMCLNINGSWDCSAVVQFWSGRDLAASGTPSLVSSQWFYDAGRWGPMAGYQPADGETVGLFVCAGNCRNTNVGTFSVVHERSNVALVQWSNH